MHTWDVLVLYDITIRFMIKLAMEAEPSFFLKCFTIWLPQWLSTVDEPN